MKSTYWQSTAASKTSHSCQFSLPNRLFFWLSPYNKLPLCHLQLFVERVAKTPELEFVLDIEISKNCELIKVFLSMNSGWISNENNFF